MILKIQSLLIAIYLFFAGFIYGNAPKEIEFTCNVPSGVHEYAEGNEIVLDVASKNIGRPFKTDILYTSYDIDIYQIVNGEKISLIQRSDHNNSDDSISLPGYVVEPYERLIKSGQNFERTYTFIVSENAPKGDYIISVSQFGEIETFEGLITVK